jgi:hypothetical protein
VLLCLIPTGAYYFWIISFGFPSFFEPTLHGRTFNSMLLHLLQGSFDVDAAAIGDEGTLRNGRVYAYFGILPAVLRAPFLLAPGFLHTDVTRLGCLVAACTMAAFKLASALTVWQHRGRPDRAFLLVLLAVSILLGGSQIPFLRAVIYQEVALWAAALAAAFVYLVLRGYYSERGFTGSILAGLAVVAGLCLNTRVSTALGLCVAFGLLWLQLAWQAVRTGDFAQSPAAAIMRFLPAAAIVCVFAGLAGVVNYGRWGDPLIFTDPQNYLWAMIHEPDRLQRDAEYGLFNVVRVGFGLIYYFLPVWVLPGRDGELLFESFRRRTMDAVELPPSSFLVSDPLTIGLAVFALLRLLRRRGGLDRRIALPVLAGLAVPIALMLTWLSMTFRYRLEFYPFLELCAFFGFALLLARGKPPPRRWFAAAAFAGVVAAHALWLLYMISPLGDASALFGGRDVVSFYRSILR